jgi:hypothetical protein
MLALCTKEHCGNKRNAENIKFWNVAFHGVFGRASASGYEEERGLKYIML